MSQRNVEILLGKLLTDEAFRRAFFPLRSESFEVAGSFGLELTPVERQALSALKRRRFDFIAQTLDPRISRLCGIPSCEETPTSSRSRWGVS